MRVTLRILGLRVLQQCRGAKRANALISDPFNNWKKMHDVLTNHSLLKYHMQSEYKMKGFIGYLYGSTKANLSSECAEQ